MAHIGGMPRAQQLLNGRFARGCTGIPRLLVATIAIVGALLSTTAASSDAQEQVKSRATLPANVPLWAYGYKARPVTYVDFQAKCATGKPVDCIRGTGPAASDKLDVPQVLQGSTHTFTLPEIWDYFGPADWFPEDHPPMPDIVAHGRREEGVPACAICHLPNGKGLMQNGAVIGLPADYIVQQLRDFKAGRRQSTDSNKSNAFAMMAIARRLTDEDMRVAAAYFSVIRPRQWMHVVESDVVPRFDASINGLFSKAEGSEMEPLGRRLIEMPELTYETVKLRDPHATYVAYVPAGSLAAGARLVTAGNASSGAAITGNHTIACGTCHGNDLRGTTLGPPIAGRSPSYLARQLFDFKTGARAGDKAALMVPAVRNLTEDDLIAIVAYVASLPP